MELNNNRLARMCNNYLHKKNRELVLKKREDQVNSIIKGIVIGKAPSEIIEMLQEITEKVNDKLDDKLRESLNNVTIIGNYKKIKK